MVFLNDILLFCRKRGVVRQVSGPKPANPAVRHVNFINDNLDLGYLNEGCVVFLHWTNENEDDCGSLAQLCRRAAERNIAALFIIGVPSRQCNQEIVPEGLDVPLFWIQVSEKDLLTFLIELLQTFEKPAVADHWIGPQLTPISHPINHIAEELRSYINNPVTIEDSNFDVIGFSRHDYADQARLSTILNKGCTLEVKEPVRGAGFTERVNRAKVPLRLPAIPEIGFDTRVVMPIRVGREILGYIWVAEYSGTVSEAGMGHIMDAASKVASVILQRQTIEAALQPKIDEMLRNVFTGSVETEDSIRAQLKALGYDVLVCWFVMFFRVEAFRTRKGIEEQVSISKTVKASAFKTIKGVLGNVSENRKGYAIVSSMNEIQALLAYPEPLTDESLRLLATTIFNEVRSKMDGSMSGVALSAGVGEVTRELMEVHKSYDEAVRAACIGRALWGPGRLTFASDLGLFRLMYDMKEASLDEISTQFWPLLEAHDAERNASLAVTVRRYLDCLGNVRKASKMLFIHPNTLLYRLRKVAEITGVDIQEEPNSRLLVHLELTARQILEMKDSLD